jgi:hypothetical protein
MTHLRSSAQGSHRTVEEMVSAGEEGKTGLSERFEWKCQLTMWEQTLTLKKVKTMKDSDAVEAQVMGAVGVISDLNRRRSGHAMIRVKAARRGSKREGVRK